MELILHFSGAYSGVVDCLFVSLFVRHFSRITALRILPKLGMKLEGDELGTVTEPDFPGKFWIIQKSRKRVFADFAISDGFFEKSKSSTQTFLV